MCRSSLLLALGVLCVRQTLAAPAEDPEPADAQARAVAALAHARILGMLAAPPKSVVGLLSGGEAGAKLIQGSAKGLESAMTDLHARVVGEEIHIELSADVLFDFDKATLRPEAAATLAKAALILRAHPGSRVRVEGHTDSKGTHEYNLNLSERRSKAVVAWFEEKEGFKAATLEARGLAETKPVAPNTKPDGSDNPAGRQKNRRVEIVVSTGR